MLTYEYYRQHPDEYKKCRGQDVPLNCCTCFELYYRSPRTARRFRLDSKNYCSKKCQSTSQTTSVTSPCGWCNADVTRELYVHKANKRHIFCNNSCAAKYNNRNKTTGTRRSKIETYIGEQLSVLYPDLKIITNSVELTGFELDFYFPELKFALELPNDPKT